MHHQPHLIDRLPHIRGRLTANAPLANVTWFRVGGPAEVMFKPADAADLSAFLAGCPADVPVTVIGVASNLLVRDGGVPGVVIRLGRARGYLRGWLGNHRRSGGTRPQRRQRRARCQHRRLEFLSGIPAPSAARSG